MRRAMIATAAMVLFAPAIAAAQPAPLAPTPGEEPYSVATADLLGPVATVAGAGVSALVLSAALDSPSGGAQVTAVALTLVAATTLPSAGHWYAGKGVTRGMVTRGVGAGLAAVAIHGFATQCGDGKSCGELGLAGIGLLGGTAYLVGMIDDFTSAGRRAMDANAAHRRRVQLAPTIGSGQAGLVIAGTF